MYYIMLKLVLLYNIIYLRNKSWKPECVLSFNMDWRILVFYIYVCGKCRTQFMLPMEKSVTFTGACVNEIIPSINHSFVYKAKEGRHVRIIKICLNSTKFTCIIASCMM